jgi:hypothetical protein
LEGGGGTKCSPFEVNLREKELKNP